MKPVMQTRFGDPEGNCLMAAIASILEIDLETCPDLYDIHRDGGSWWEALESFLVEGHRLLPVLLADQYPPKGYAIVNGEGVRGLDHSCVALDGVVVHDPHPDGGGLKTDRPCTYIALVPLAEEPHDGTG